MQFGNQHQLPRRIESTLAKYIPKVQGRKVSANVEGEAHRAAITIGGVGLKRNVVVHLQLSIRVHIDLSAGLGRLSQRTNGALSSSDQRDWSSIIIPANGARSIASEKPTYPGRPCRETPHQEGESQSRRGGEGEAHRAAIIFGGIRLKRDIVVHFHHSAGVHVNLSAGLERLNAKKINAD